MIYDDIMIRWNILGLTKKIFKFKFLRLVMWLDFGK